MRDKEDEDIFDKLDTEYYEDKDDIETKMDNFAIETGLVKNA